MLQTHDGRVARLVTHLEENVEGHVGHVFEPSSTTAEMASASEDEGGLGTSHWHCDVTHIAS